MASERACGEFTDELENVWTFLRNTYQSTLLGLHLTTREEFGLMGEHIMAIAPLGK